MKSFAFLSIVLFVTQVFAGWAEDFEILKNRSRDYEDAGSICEEIAKIQFEKKYDLNKYLVDVGIAYNDSQRTIGELDIVVFERNTNQVIHVAEVKCWKDAGGGLQKAKEQRQRFLNNIRSNKALTFRSTSTDQVYSQEQFKKVNQFSTIGQKGSLKNGYEEELEYDLRELHKMRVEMLRCQDSGVCVKP